MAVLKYKDPTTGEWKSFPMGVDIESLKLEILQTQNPIGTLRFQTVSTNPADILGFGTWILWGSGRVPVGVDSSNTNFNTVEKTGGEISHSLTTSEMPSHTHTYSRANSPSGSTVLTINQIPSHTHGWKYAIAAASGSDEWSSAGTNATGTANDVINSAGGGQGHTHTISNTSVSTGSSGSGSSHNNLQPYITCYIFKRTA